MRTNRWLASFGFLNPGSGKLKSARWHERISDAHHTNHKSSLSRADGQTHADSLTLYRRCRKTAKRASGRFMRIGN